MIKRNLATAMWFVVGWTGGSMLFGYLNAPGALALVPAVAIAMLIHIDPMGAIWPADATRGRRIRPIEELAAELDRKAEGAGVVAEERSAR